MNEFNSVNRYKNKEYIFINNFLRRQDAENLLQKNFETKSERDNEQLNEANLNDECQHSKKADKYNYLVECLNDVKKIINDMDYIISRINIQNKHPLPPTLFRGVKSFPHELRIGSYFFEHAYSSFSSSQEVAQGSFTIQNPASYLFILHTTELKNVNYFCYKEILYNDIEQEFLLQRNLKYTVTNISGNYVFVKIESFTRQPLSEEQLYALNYEKKLKKLTESKKIELTESTKNKISKLKEFYRKQEEWPKYYSNKQIEKIYNIIFKVVNKFIEKKEENILDILIENEENFFDFSVEEIIEDLIRVINIDVEKNSNLLFKKITKEKEEQFKTKMRLLLDDFKNINNDDDDENDIVRFILRSMIFKS